MFDLTIEAGGLPADLIDDEIDATASAMRQIAILRREERA
jgi:hypothetical protein